MSSRREFFRDFACAATPLALLLPARQEPGRPIPPPAQGGGAAPDTLAIPASGSVAAVGRLDNDPGVIAIERRLRCKCGCTLDVYTCRTTDFSCTYSPVMHQDVVAQTLRGATADQILASFVAREGEKVLMSPPAKGFNVMGYIVPGLTVTAFGVALAAWLLRARAEPAVVAARHPGSAAAAPDAEQLERLRRALDGIDS